MVNKYVVLVCGLNIRDQNRITLDEQRFALDAVANELEARPVGDKGSYAVASDHESHHVVELVLGALAAHRPDLRIPGAAVAPPVAVADALAELTRLLASEDEGDFNPRAVVRCARRCTAHGRAGVLRAVDGRAPLPARVVRVLSEPHPAVALARDPNDAAPARPCLQRGPDVAPDPSRRGLRDGRYRHRRSRDHGRGTWLPLAGGRDVRGARHRPGGEPR